MARYSVQLSGARDYLLHLDVSLWSQDANGNTSTIDWVLHVQDVAGWGSFANYATSWNVNIGPVPGTGSIGSFPAGSFTISSGRVTIGHAANGTLTIDVNGYWDSQHSNVGAGTAAGAFTLPTINRLPNAPTVLGFDQVTDSSVRFRFGNAGGGPATAWQIEYATNPNFTGSTLVYSGGTSTLTGLTAGATYWARARGVNDVGNGPWSAASSATLLLNAPAFTSWAQDANGGLVAAWSAPTPTTGLAGYRLQVARDAGFTTGVLNIDTPVQLTATVTDQASGRIYYARVAARTASGVNVYSAARSTMLVLESGDLDSWQRFGPAIPQLAYFTASGIRRGTVAGAQALIVESLSTDTASIALDTLGIFRDVSGLTVGKAYRFEASAALTNAAARASWYRLRVVNESSAPAVQLGTSSTPLGYVEFVADATTARLEILLSQAVAWSGAVDEIERAAFSGIRLLELGTDYPVRLAETVYESNLANHFDLACNSVGAGWSVGKDGVTRFRLPGAALPVSAVFTDQPNAAALHYIDVNAAYDTRGMVNRLDVTNYGVDADRTNEENETLIVTSPASVSTYGVRSARLDVNLWGAAPYDESLNARLAALLDAADEPRLFIESVRWNAQENLAAANALDVGQRVRVHFRGIEQDSQIVYLQHDFTPRRWIITAKLQRI